MGNTNEKKSTPTKAFGDGYSFQEGEIKKIEAIFAELSPASSE